MKYVLEERLSDLLTHADVETQKVLLEKFAKQYCYLCCKLPFTRFGFVYFAIDVRARSDDDDASFYQRARTYTTGPYVCPPRSVNVEVEWPDTTFSNIRDF